MDTAKNLVLWAIICGTGYMLYRNREKLFRIIANRQPETSQKEVKSLSTPMQDVCKAFTAFANNFQGLYEPLYKASKGTISQERKNNVLVEWNIRIGNISQIPIGLKSWWTTIVTNLDSLSDEDLQKRAAQVMEMIKACGIIRDNQKKLIAKSDTNMYYQNTDGKTWSIGQELLVESPCWFIQSNPVRIIEKGYCNTL